MLELKLVGFEEEMSMAMKVGIICTGALPTKGPSALKMIEMLQDTNPQQKAREATKNENCFLTITRSPALA